MGVSMYSELLSELYYGMESTTQPDTHSELVGTMLRCRHRLRQRSGDGTRVTAEALVMELDHDRHLLQLCAAMGIAEDPASFVNRDSAREALLEALRSRGVDL
jgi:hypothetical protein